MTRTRNQTAGTSRRPPLFPREGCLSEGHRVVTSGELLPEQPVPLLLAQPSAQR